MTATDVLNLVGSILFLACVPAVNLAVWQMSRVTWRATPIGRHLMAYMAVLAAVFDLSAIALITRWFDVTDALWFQALRLVVFAGMPVVLWWRWWLIRRARSGKL